MRKLDRDERIVAAPLHAHERRPREGDRQKCRQDAGRRRPQQLPGGGSQTNLPQQQPGGGSQVNRPQQQPAAPAQRPAESVNSLDRQYQSRASGDRAAAEYRASASRGYQGGGAYRGGGGMGGGGMGGGGRRR